MKEFTCDICAKSFGNKSNLKRHIKSTHQPAEEFKCDSCKKSFVRKDVLKNHVKSVHEKPTAASTTLVKCTRDNCDFEGSSSGLSRHLKKHNDCDKCGKTFLGSNAKQNLKNHMKTHDPKPAKKPKKVHTCEICKRDFEWNCELKNHMINCKKRFNLMKNANQ